MRVRLPQPGEVWILDKTYGSWTFAALVSSPRLYLQGRDTGWLLVPTTWLPTPAGSTLVASVRRVEQRVNLRTTVGNFTATSTTFGTVAPAGWQPSASAVSFPLVTPTKTAGVLTLNAASTGLWQLALTGTGAGIAINETTWLTDDNWPDVTGMQAAS